jgi:hypothetical protein
LIDGALFSPIAILVNNSVITIQIIPFNLFIFL